jgi:16S rRNA C1402 N4-methylase RsmH
MAEVPLERSSERLTVAASQWLDVALFHGAFAVDATVGNGYDTLFLAHRVGEQGRVLGFDVQKVALNGAAELLRFAGVLNRVTLILESHSNISRYLSAGQIVHGAMFNLGYLPRGNRQIITQPETTLAALQALLEHLAPHGRLTLLSYRGHTGGTEECTAVREFLRSVRAEEFSVRELAGMQDTDTTPRLFLVERAVRTETPENSAQRGRI